MEPSGARTRTPGDPPGTGMSTPRPSVTTVHPAAGGGPDTPSMGQIRTPLDPPDTTLATTWMVPPAAPTGTRKPGSARVTPTTVKATEPLGGTGREELRGVVGDPAVAGPGGLVDELEELLDGSLRRPPPPPQAASASAMTRG